MVYFFLTNQQKYQEGNLAHNQEMIIHQLTNRENFIQNPSPWSLKIIEKIKNIYEKHFADKKKLQLLST